LLYTPQGDARAVSLSVESTVADEGWSVDLEERLRKLQTDTLLITLVAVAGLGVLLLRVPESLLTAAQSMIGASLFFMLVGSVYVIHRWRDDVAAWVLLAGVTALLLLTLTWTGHAPLIFLFIIPTIIATLLVSIPVGLGAALIFTVFIAAAPDGVAGLDLSIRFTAVIGIWATEGALLLTLQPLLRTVQWAWYGYERAREALDQARDSQQRLQETLEDLTEANAQLTRLNRLAQALRQAADNERRIKEQFVANVSHELRTPLNMIVGFCEMIMESPEAYGDPVPPTLLSDLDVVFRNSQHLASLVDDVLDLSQIEAGQMSLVREHVIFDDIINSAITAVRPLFQSKSLRLDVDLPDDLPVVFCDHVRVREVMLNLLSNAGRFTERGGVKVTVARTGDELIIGVADTGPGISTTQQARLFRPFEQLDGSIRRRYGGTGLGLSISKSFVELHEGRMWVESEEGEGTTFYFSLPIAGRASLDEGYMRWIDPYNPYESRARPPRLPKVDVKPRWVIVEQGTAMLRMLSRHLEGIDLVPAATLEAATQSLTETPAQALLINHLDVGASLMELQNRLALPFAIPVIVCSIPGVEQAANGLGVSDYLVKPISREKLLSALQKLDRPIGTVLIVDDEREALMLFRRILSGSDPACRVLRAQNGRQALQILEQHRPDVILLDLTMPEMDGFELLKVRKEAPWHDIPVILISARDPLGHPIMSNALAVTVPNGLSVTQILSSIQMFTKMLSPGITDQDKSPAGSNQPTHQRATPA
jgi:signal transduction histidine kinase/CheY-like chemotaxis protein